MIKKESKLQGMNLTPDKNQQADPVPKTLQSKLCTKDGNNVKVDKSLLFNFRTLSPEPALECDEEMAPSPDQITSRPRSRAASTPPPILTPHPPSPSSSSPSSSPGPAANPPKGADGPCQGEGTRRSQADLLGNSAEYRRGIPLGPPLRTRKLIYSNDTLLLLAK